MKKKRKRKRLKMRIRMRVKKIRNKMKKKRKTKRRNEEEDQRTSFYLLIAKYSSLQDIEMLILMSLMQFTITDLFITEDL